MCLIAFSFDPHHSQPIVLAANRDEYFARATHAPSWWRDHPGVFGGRDALAGGTWMAVFLPAREAGTGDRICRFAALTNVRASVSVPASPPSRGHLVTQMFNPTIPLESLLHDVATRSSSYDGFNLLAFEWRETTGANSNQDSSVTDIEGWHFSNCGPYKDSVESITPGVHGVSNGAFNEPWPKTMLVTDAMKTAINASESSMADEHLMNALKNTAVAEDHLLPDTGIKRAAERDLSMPFIRARFDSSKQRASYGTRTSTLFNLHRSGQCRFKQISWDSECLEPRVSAIREMHGT